MELLVDINVDISPLHSDKRQRSASAQDICQVVLVKADITTLPVDAIVNAANNQLRRGGGVCGSVFKAAGPSLDAACAAAGGCATGGAVLTGPFNIHNVKAIIHAVGPRVSGPLTDAHRQQLASAYTHSLDVAMEHGLSSIV
jgi:O-acetyl-ADP-ribose deacetylase (regulator of RNase III)